jgi:hypothetical protein
VDPPNKIFSLHGFNAKLISCNVYAGGLYGVPLQKLLYRLCTGVKYLV